MESTNWAPEHSDALRDYFAQGMSFLQIASAINAKFKTTYSRNATIGRAKRIGLVQPRQVPSPPLVPAPTSISPSAPTVRACEPISGKSRWLQLYRLITMLESAKPVELRGVDIIPRHLSLLELGRDDCRYPYGGEQEGEPITFCGHPKHPGQSYCVSHFHLSRNLNTEMDPLAPASLHRLSDTV